MAEQIASFNSKVPSTMASRVHDLDNRGFWTDESYADFAMFLGPIVLKGRLGDEYYDNFLRFSVSRVGLRSGEWSLKGESFRSGVESTHG